MQDIVKPLGEQLALHAALFDLGLKDLADEDARRRPGPALNSPIWLAGHLATGRAHMLSVVTASPTAAPFENRFEGAVPDEDLAGLPSLDAINTRWQDLSRRLMAAVASADAARWKTSPQAPFPTVEATNRAALAFLISHEAYHLGQLSAARRHLGLAGLFARYAGG